MAHSARQVRQSQQTNVGGADYGPLDGGPVVRVPGTVSQGTQLPNDVSPTPIQGRPGYGAAIVNGHRAIVDLNSNSAVHYSQ